jgi:murein L,D-transpeptidase YcbB/YkuD
VPNRLQKISELLVLVYILGTPTIAFAQQMEDARQFLMHQYASQHQTNDASQRQTDDDEFQNRRANYDVRTNVVPRHRALPQEVKSPEYYNYAPDSLIEFSSAQICKVDVASNSAISDSQNFAEACSFLKPVTFRVLPMVGKALAAYYSAHPGFIWSQDGKITPKAMAAIAELSASDRVGLSPDDYRVEIPDKFSNDTEASARELLQFELSLSSKILTYIHDTVRGRVDPNRISGYHDLPRKEIKLIDALKDISESDDVATYLANRNPHNPQFQALVAELARLQNEAAEYPATTSSSKKTKRAAAEQSVTEKTSKIRLAMERLRWLPDDLGDRYVFINEPAFVVNYVVNEKDVLSMRAIVGKPSTQTYFFMEHIKSVEYNPYWNVPHSIVVNEMLPKMARNSSYLDRLGYEITNERGDNIPSSKVSWSRLASPDGGISVRQPPGPKNALGRLKIEFPNKHAIYMHDTPERQLFGREARALSHGCVRVEHPRQLAAALLGKSLSHVSAKIDDKKNSTEAVQQNIAVYIAYFTAWPDTQGAVRYYNDVYKRDSYLSEALRKTEASRTKN